MNLDCSKWLSRINGVSRPSDTCEYRQSTYIAPCFVADGYIYEKGKNFDMAKSKVMKVYQIREVIQQKHNYLQSVRHFYLKIVRTSYLYEYS